MFVWGYALAWFLVNDRVKLLAYRIFDPAKAEVNPEAKPKPQAEAKAKTPLDLTPQIATRAYELYEQQGHRDGRSVQNWNRAESEIQKDQFKPDPSPEAKAQPETRR